MATDNVIPASCDPGPAASPPGVKISTARACYLIRSADLLMRDVGLGPFYDADVRSRAWGLLEVTDNDPWLAIAAIEEVERALRWMEAPWWWRAWRRLCGERMIQTERQSTWRSSEDAKQPEATLAERLSSSMN